MAKLISPIRLHLFNIDGLNCTLSKNHNSLLCTFCTWKSHIQSICPLKIFSIHTFNLYITFKFHRLVVEGDEPKTIYVTCYKRTLISNSKHLIKLIEPNYIQKPRFHRLQELLKNKKIVCQDNLGSTGQFTKGGQMGYIIQFSSNSNTMFRIRQKSNWRTWNIGSEHFPLRPTLSMLLLSHRRLVDPYSTTRCHLEGRRNPAKSIKQDNDWVVFKK